MWFWRYAIPQRLKTRRALESTFFASTFVAALVTVSLSASTILPCPANGHGALVNRFHPSSRGALSEEDEASGKHSQSGYHPESLPVGGLGQRAYLTRSGGWIEIDERPSFFSGRRWTSASA